MRYVSTRGGTKPQPFTGILLEGLAPDGGLFLPAEVPKLAPADPSALRGKKNIRVFMLSPYGRMSAFQAAQMYSLADANIFDIAVRGVFDECQDVVKAISGDVAFKAKHRIGAVNSINWARVAAQLVYYFKACFAVGGGGSLAVPSGDFGHVYAGPAPRPKGPAIP